MWLFLLLFCLKTLFVELLHAKPCRTVMKLPQKVSFGPEACKIGPKVGNRTCPGGPRGGRPGGRRRSAPVAGGRRRSAPVAGGRHRSPAVGPGVA